MRILWLCNFMLPMVAEYLGLEATNKEGWISGLAGEVLGRQHENEITLAVASPIPESLLANVGSSVDGAAEESVDGSTMDGARDITADSTAGGRADSTADSGAGSTADSRADGTVASRADGIAGNTASSRECIYKAVIPVGDSRLQVYGFYENTATPHLYDEQMEGRLRKITEDFAPDVVHCFGTEYPHTLALCRSFPDKSRILIGMQGLIHMLADAYFANMPGKAIVKVTLRDFLRKDSTLSQQQKFAARGTMEIEAIKLAGNITGRTAWDRQHTQKWNPQATYYHMNETLRSNFYEGAWSLEKCIPHSIFVSQGDYPLKGLHYVLHALPAIRERYPDVKVYVAGNSLVNYKTLKDKLKISGYGKYLRSLIQKYHLESNIEFTGRLTAEQMKAQYLKSHLFLCCSSLENSPNSLGEAMLLGVPCVSACVGGVPSLFTDDVDGIGYEGYRMPEQARNDASEGDRQNLIKNQEKDLDRIVCDLTDSIFEMWENEKKMLEFCDNARNHARTTHNREGNYQKMTEIYASIISSK